MDEGRIAFTPAVELSYLNELEQSDLAEKISLCDATPNLSQACRFKKISQEQGLTPKRISEIMSEEKAGNVQAADGEVTKICSKSKPETNSGFGYQGS